MCSCIAVATIEFDAISSDPFVPVGRRMHHGHPGFRDRLLPVAPRRQHGRPDSPSVDREALDAVTNPLTHDVSPQPFRPELSASRDDT